MNVALIFLTSVIAVFTAYAFVRFIKRPAFITFFMLIVQMTVLTVVLLSVVENVLTVPQIELAFVILGVLIPVAVLFYDYRQMVAEFKKSGKFKGLIRSSKSQKDKSFDLSVYLDTLKDITGELKAHQLKQSLDVLDRALKENIEKIIDMIQNLIKEGKYNEAYWILKVLTQICDDNPYIAYNYANICVKIERYKEAYREYNRSIKLFRRIQTHGKDFEDIKRTRNVVKIKGFYLCLQYNCAFVLYKLGKYEYSVARLKKSLKEGNETKQIYFNMAAAYIKMGKKENAARCLENALKLEKCKRERIKLEYALGKIFFELGDFKKAIYSLENALKSSPKFAKALEIIASIYMKEGRYEQAFLSYKKLSRLKPKDTVYLFNMGVLSYKLGRKTDALMAYKRLLRISKDDFPALYNIGLILDELGRPMEAIGYLKRAIQINQDFEDAYNALGVILSSIGEYREAIKIFKEAQKRYPKSFKLWYNRGISLLTIRRFTDAAFSFEKALLLNPEEVDAYFNLASIYTLKGYYDKALSVYKKALKHMPDNAKLFYEIAKIYANLGEKELAIENLEKAASKDARFKEKIKNAKEFIFATSHKELKE